MAMGPLGCKALKTWPTSWRIKTQLQNDPISCISCTRRTTLFHRIQKSYRSSGWVSRTLNWEIDRRMSWNWSLCSKNRRIVLVKLAKNTLSPWFRSPSRTLSDIKSCEIVSAIQVSSCRHSVFPMIRAIIHLPMMEIHGSGLLHQRLRICPISGEGGTSFQFLLRIIRSVMLVPARSPSTMWVEFRHVRRRRLLVNSETESDDSVWSRN